MAAQFFKRELTAQLKFSGGIRGVAFACGAKSKWFVKIMSERVWQHTRKVWGHRYKMEDKRNDNYVERVADLQTGEEIHFCNEKLSEHRGHGSAKKRMGANNCS
jgi:hypothetical protein